MEEKDRDKPLYAIGVVAKMLDVSQQTLRIYEKETMVVPKRTEKNTRLYSKRDVEELQRIITLHKDLGVNLPGVEIILRMRRRMEEMQAEYQRVVDMVREHIRVDIDIPGEEAVGLVPLDPAKLISLRNIRKKTEQKQMKKKK
ncbi:MAG: MerR family transcriptional regulator [bacterium]